MAATKLNFSSKKWNLVSLESFFSVENSFEKKNNCNNSNTGDILNLYILLMRLYYSRFLYFDKMRWIHFYFVWYEGGSSYYSILVFLSTNTMDMIYFIHMNMILYFNSMTYHLLHEYIKIWYYILFVCTLDGLFKFGNKKFLDRFVVLLCFGLNIIFSCKLLLFLLC